ncbi:DNA (cytosine-5-)-methyltransferase [Kiloniella antarctica]|uniref:Cytosine-specific methyltransferase n=1 Tax=Kiloniella antarctica TaxID=1550907 RepID=A0ABW5BM23_9PROT
MQRPFTYGSVCSGIEAATVAWEPLGWKPAFFSEIEKFPRAVLQHHWPDVPLHGDFTTIKGDEYESIDLLVGGTPCQSFSVAGLRGGMDDDRGNLALEFLRLAKRTGAKWVVWENVPGVLSSNGGRDFGSLLGALGELGFQWAYRVLDAQYFGVPQRRRRVFVVGYLGKEIHPAAVLFERHSLCGNSAPSREAGQEIAGTLEASLGRSRGAGTPIGAITTDTSKLSHWSGGPHPSLCQSARGSGGIAMSNQELFSQGGAGLVGTEFFGGGNCSGPINVAATLTAKGCRQDFEVETFVAHRSSGHGTYSEGIGTLRAVGGDVGPGSENLITAYRTAGDGAVYEEGDKTAPLTTGTDKSANIVAFAQNSRDELREMPYAGALSANPGMKQTSYVRDGMAVRRLTPVECERLQGLPDNHTQIPYRNKPAELCPDGPRYKAIGNSMPEPVMRWLGERIQAVEDLRRAPKAEAAE